MKTYYKHILFILILTFSSACSTFDGKFKETHQINLAPFSENVAIMANELEYGFDKIRSLHSKWYFDLNSKKIKRLLNLEKLVTQEIHFIVDYSSHIVYLSESNKPMIEKTTKLSRYVKQMYTRYQNSKTLVLTEEQKDTFIENIKKQDDFLTALQTAQPFINELARYANRLLDQLKKAENDVAYSQYAKIDSENEHLKALILSLNKNEKEISNTIVLLNQYENGSKSAFKKLKKSKILHQQSIIQTKDSLTKNQIGLLKKHLLNELTENTNYFTQLEPSYNRYILAQKELLRLVSDHDAEIRKTRLVFITFASAHRKMASGIVKPAEWFNIKEAPKLLLKLLPI
ncbi:MAG: hypothetical protein ACC653_11100 [Gammaproteobacteria bacterium]